MKTLVFNSQGRYGDIIAASMVANMLIEVCGYTLYWVTLPRYVKLVESACPECLCFGINKFAVDDSWGDATMADIAREFQGERVFNAQFGATENHDAYIASGKHPLEWLREKAESELGVELPTNYRDYLRWKHPIIKPQAKQPYCIIAPNATTYRAIYGSAMSDENVSKLFQDAQKIWYAKLLVKEVGHYKAGLCLSGYTFCECVEIIKSASHFVGLDSGLAWASLYSECGKTIYHKRERFEQVHTAFGFLDPKAEDVIQ